LRILRVTSDLYPYVIGGIGVHAREMSKSQAKLGHEVTILTTSMADNMPDNQDGFRIACFKNGVKLLGNTISSELLFKLFRIRKNYDIIHAHSHLFFSTNICALVRKIGSSPLVITNHGIMSASAPDWFNLLYLKTLGKWTLNTADKIICYTEEEKEKLIRILNINASKIAVIPNGIDTNQFHPRLRDHAADTINLLWVGRFVKGKGVEYIVQAMGILVKERPDLHLTLVGEGPERDCICELIESLGLSDNVSIIDFVPYDKMPRVFQDSDIFVLPSLHEGVPRTALEAMSCGLPVVISDFSHLRDLIDGGGLMFPKKDVQALADSLRILINDDDKRAKMGRKAREKIVREYSWERTVAGTLDVYQGVVSSAN
jgi:glycogen(starch) synthase